ncbi:hypothetical protein [Lactiplantibacillus herbarum]|uniref:hypothetical protein n=1 Tax=Lactiplantibacillus herbarum TaxID=1670446 RepID=UPI00064E819F|nr:hypothetical protein [Lactiplantibacillus herbarum]
MIQQTMINIVIVAILFLIALYLATSMLVTSFRMGYYIVKFEFFQYTSKKRKIELYKKLLNEDFKEYLQGLLNTKKEFNSLLDNINLLRISEEKPKINENNLKSRINLLMSEDTPIEEADVEKYLKETGIWTMVGSYRWSLAVYHSHKQQQKFYKSISKHENRKVSQKQVYANKPDMRLVLGNLF